MHPTSLGTSVTSMVFALIFVALNAFFVAAEFAIVKVRLTRLEEISKNGNRIALLARHMVEHLDPYLSATQLGITLASLGLGWLGEPAFAVVFYEFFHSLGIAVSDTFLHSLSISAAFLMISALHIVLGELVPKSIAIQSAERVVLLIAVPLRGFYVVFFPFLWVLNKTSTLVLRLIRFSGDNGEGAPSEAELKLIVEDSFEEGEISQGKRVLLDKAIDFSNKTVTQIMVPERDMICLYLDLPFEENLQRAKDSAHTRFPIRQNFDAPVLGFVHMKDIVWSLENGDFINLYDMIRPILFFEAKMMVEAALKSFQKRKIHLAVVKSETGGVLGLVSLEDVIEELVGDIEDEFDVE